MIKQNRLAMIYNTTGLAERRFNFSKRFICHPSTADEAGQNTSLIPRLSPAPGESLGTRLALWLTSHNIVVLSCCGSMIVCVHVNVIIQLHYIAAGFSVVVSSWA